MDVAEAEESLFAATDAKLHGAMCNKLSTFVSKVLGIFPELEAARPRSNTGIQALCSLHIALEKAKNLLQHCSHCSKLYLAITGDSILLKFEKAKGALAESLRRVEDIVPQSIGSQILQIVNELESTVFSLDRTEKQVGDEAIALLQQDKKLDSDCSDNNELEIFHQAATRLGIISSRAALTERRALKRLIERARLEEDKRKESIVAYLLYLMRKYSKHFKSEFSDDNDSKGGSAPCSPTVLDFEESGGSINPGHAFDRQLIKLGSLNFKPSSLKFGNMPIPPEEFRCPISLQLMYDPVIISSGQTYERDCIEKWFSDGHNTCPKTQQELSHLCLTPNYCVKGLITSWCEHNGVPLPVGPPESPNLNYWRLTFAESEVSDSRSMKSIDICKLEEVKTVPLQESRMAEKVEENEINHLDGSCQVAQDSEADYFERFESLLAIMQEGETIQTQQRVVEQIRFLLKDDEEARIYMGAKGFVEALLAFLRSAFREGVRGAQEAGAMALFNLAVNNNRNKELMLSADVLPLLEEMILDSDAYESATALFLNLSCLQQAKPIIGSSAAVSVFVQLLLTDSTKQCKLDALHTLYNLSTHPINIPMLLSAGIVNGLHSLLSDPADCTWTENSISVLINAAASKSGKEEIVSSPGLVSILASILDTGKLLEQEQAVSCLLLLCNGDEKCSQIVLQEGVIPSLVSLSVNGTARGKEKAQKLLMLFREQRQRDASPVRLLEEAATCALVVPKSKPFCRSRTRKVVMSWASLWKSKKFSGYQW